MRGGFFWIACNVLAAALNIAVGGWCLYLLLINGFALGVLSMALWELSGRRS